MQFSVIHISMISHEDFKLTVDNSEYSNIIVATELLM